MQRAVWVAATLVLSACTAQAQTTPMASTTTTTSAPALAPISTAVQADQGAEGPGGMTLRQEVGAVLMVGFTGPLTPAVLDDWRQRQFGALLLPSNQGGSDSASTAGTIGSVRGLMTHPLMAASDVQGAAATSSELKALGFDIDLAPEADVRAYPNEANAIHAVQTAIAGEHAAGMYAVAKHFQNRDLSVFRAAIAAHVDMIMVGDLETIPGSGSDLSGSWPAWLQVLRDDLHFQGPVISDDLQLPIGRPGYSPAAAAVRFLESGGDMVMVSHDMAVADGVYDAIYSAVSDGTYPRAQLDASVQKLLNLRLRYMP